MKKIIHYCWFGNKKMEDYTIACIKSWQEHFPNYQIMVWNENNFDVNICDYTKEAYEAKQYAFVSDYVRLYALYNYGGIYFDTDYEVFKNFEDLLTADLTLGFESIGKVQTAMMFSKKSNPNLLHLINYYNTQHFIQSDKSYSQITNVEIISNYLLKLGLKNKNVYQKFNNIEIYPSEYFCPIDFNSGSINITKKSMGIHSFSGTWLDKNQKIYFKNKRLLGREEAKEKQLIFKNSSSNFLKYSIIITFYKNLNQFQACLNALSIALKNRKDYEIIIVNDNEFQKLNRNHFNNIKNIDNLNIINNDKNVGYSAACNIGSSNSNGEYLIFIDSDIIVDSMWLIEMELTAKKHPDFGAISSKILKQSNNGIEYFGMLLYEVDSIKPKYQNNRPSKYISKDRKFNIVTSGSMLISKKLFNSIGGFDETLYNSHCDLDLSLKISSKNNYVSNKSIAYHGGATSGDIRYVSYIKARSLFFKKWASFNMNDITLKELEEMYSEYKENISSRYYKVFNFSNTRYDEVYLKVLEKALNIHIVSKIDLRNTSQSPIQLYNLLDYSIVETSMPIIYFVDNFNLIINNKLWFNERPFKRDLIIDWNGNIIPINEI